MATFLDHLKERIEQLTKAVHTNHQILFEFYKHLLEQKDKRNVEKIKKNLDL